MGAESNGAAVAEPREGELVKLEDKVAEGKSVAEAAAEVIEEKAAAIDKAAAERVAKEPRIVVVDDFFHVSHLENAARKADILDAQAKELEKKAAELRDSARAATEAAAGDVLERVHGLGLIPGQPWRLEMDPERKNMRILALDFAVLGGGK